MVINSRRDITFFIQAVNCNPNGDPDMDNFPRVDSDTGIGIMTDAAIKARIRAYIETAFQDVDGMKIFFKDKASINRQIAEAVFEAVGEEGKKAEKHSKSLEAAELICKNYWDVRTFGAVMNTGLNAGQVNGPVQVAFATSVDPIYGEDITLTRRSFTDGKFTSLKEYDEAYEKMADDKKRTMGSKKIIPYGLYKVNICVSANDAEKTGFSEEDFDRLLEAICQMYNFSTSASKMGMSVVTPVVIFKHVGTQADKNSEQNLREAKLGCAPAHKLFSLLRAVKKEDVVLPRRLEDYDITLDVSGLKNGIEIGLKDSAFESVTWGTKLEDFGEFEDVRLV